MAALNACASGPTDDVYQQTVRDIWRKSTTGPGNSATLHHELVRYATLAPSSHNTQCWKFRVEENAILPDFSRRTPAVDPDDHHLFVSLGCALENMIQAALANGLQSDAGFDAGATNAIRVTLSPTKPTISPLFLAIPDRQCTRGEYDGTQLSNEDLRALESAGAGNGVQVKFLTERTAMESALEYVVQANSAQMNDHAFVTELKNWVRFNAHEPVQARDGLFAATTGNPSVPSWLGRTFFSLFFKPKAENDKYAKQIRSSAGIAVFIADAEDKAHWVEVGRCYERFALQSVALGIRNAFLNQPVEMTALRPQFATFLGASGRRPDLVVRFGKGVKLPQSLRRPVSSVLL